MSEREIVIRKGSSRLITFDLSIRCYRTVDLHGRMTLREWERSGRYNAATSCDPEHREALGKLYQEAEAFARKLHKDECEQAIRALGGFPHGTRDTMRTLLQCLILDVCAPYRAVNEKEG